MKTIRFVFVLLLVSAKTMGQGKERFVTYDVDNFWHAYDKIVTTKDSAQQYTYLNTLFIQRGSPGLKSLMQAWNYTARSYIQAIIHYPLFWQSVRKNTRRAATLARKADAKVKKLQQLYPDLKPATTYFTVGALRTGGTSMGDMVLMGSELALANHTTTTAEFGPELAHLKESFKTKTDDVVLFTVIHEYIHTQQKTTLGNALLAQSVLEGMAEFLAVTATGQRSTLPAIAYGPAHAAGIQQRFAAHLFNPFTEFWLYSNEKNEFDVRDLGYYVGYALCEGYYRRAADKKRAIKTMIELDYNNEAALCAWVDQAGYFPRSTAQLKNDFQARRPRVLRVARAENAAQFATPGLSTVTLTFSSPMDPQYHNFELGPLGAAHLMRVKKFVGFSEDCTSAAFQVELQPNRQYQLLVGEGFRSWDGRSLQPFLIDFTTGAK
ncbi:hypothetical protein SAMN00120144_3699 [Hymenobacter roseosalivarius DSM 11622]|uniref:SbsA Ig-like domain-containing protein n=1 Tax=Hymenobacter roseosalivarius DSM 11622 TaxID=645990 RepID=A0A1W1W1W0_9BACT|nr:hypothetical protein [Hymenobacter roseosalivarius]SMB99612.1 hypothetical protein SAMN00120144_3699 [Hymenobacter roseosalivarius DSM 11622]